MPADHFLIPGTAPAEAFSIDRVPLAANLQILNDPLELMELGQGTARIASRQPDVAPDQMRSRRQIDADALIIAAAAKRDRGTGQYHQLRVLLDADMPLLGGETP